MRYLLNVLNKIIIVIVCFLLLVLALILFEVPIPFVVDKITTKVHDSLPQYFSHGENIKLGSVSVGWGYAINRPTIVLKDIEYTKKNSIIHIDSLSFFPNVSALWHEKKILISGLAIKGTTVSLVEDKDGSISYSGILYNNLNTKLLIQKKENINEVPKLLSDIVNQYIKPEKNICKGSCYKNILQDLNTVTLLNTLSSISLEDINVKFISSDNKNIVFKLSNALVSKEASGIKSLLNVTVLNEYQKYLTLKAMFLLDSNDTLKFNANLSNLKTTELKRLLNSMKFIHHSNALFFKSGLNASASINGSYNFNTGLKSLDYNAKIDQGQLVINSDTKLDVSSIDLQGKYNQDNNLFVVSNLNIEFNKDYKLIIPKLQAKLPILSINSKAVWDVDKNILKVSDNKLMFNSQDYINTNFILNFNKLNMFNYDLKLDTSNLQVSTLKNLWPKDFMTGLGHWVNANIDDNVVIDNTSFELSLLQVNSTKGAKVDINKLQGDVHFNQADLTYLGEGRKIHANNIDIKYDTNGALINYEKATIDDLDISSASGFVRIYNENPELAKNKNRSEKTKGSVKYMPAVKLELNLSGNLKDAFYYLDEKPLYLLKKWSLNKDQMDGNVNGKLILDYSIDNYKVNNIDLTLKAKQFIYHNIFNNYDASDGIVNFNLNNTGFQANGLAKYLSNPVLVDVNFNWYNHDKIISKYNIIANNVSVDDIKKLNIVDDVFWNYIDLKGNTDLVLSMYGNGDKSKLAFNVNLANSGVKIKALNFDKEPKEKMSISGNLYMTNFKPFMIKNFLVQSDDLNTMLDMNIDHSKNQIQTNIKYLKLNGANVYGNFLMDDSNLILNLKGDSLDITNLLSVIRSDISNKQVKSDDSIDNIYNSDIDLDSNEVLTSDINRSIKVNLGFKSLISKDKIAKNVNIMLDVLGTKINKIDIKGVFHHKNYSFASYDQDKSILNAKIYNLGYFLSFFDITDSLQSGVLNAKVNMFYTEDPEDKKTYLISRGNVNISDFIAGIRFAVADADIIGKGDLLIIKDISLIGNLLGGDYTGYVNKNYVYLTGKIVPAYSANTIISNAPIIRNLVSTLLGSDDSGKRKNILEFNSNIKGFFGNLKYSFFTNDNKNNQNFNYGKLIRDNRLGSFDTSGDDQDDDQDTKNSNDDVISSSVSSVYNGIVGGVKSIIPFASSKDNKDKNTSTSTNTTNNETQEKECVNSIDNEILDETKTPDNLRKSQQKAQESKEIIESYKSLGKDIDNLGIDNTNPRKLIIPKSNDKKSIISDLTNNVIEEIETKQEDKK